MGASFGSCFHRTLRRPSSTRTCVVCCVVLCDSPHTQTPASNLKCVRAVGSGVVGCGLRHGNVCYNVFEVWESSDAERSAFPHLSDALRAMRVVVQRAGEALFVPSGWYHQVHNLVSMSRPVPSTTPQARACFRGLSACDVWWVVGGVIG